MSGKSKISDTSRKLATILALDVAGYSARTEADEARTTAEVASLRGVIEAIALRHGGRVFNTAGDGFMLEFGSSLAAVEAAFELAETCEPKVRVGVHLGDVVVQANGDLLGHGVNVAARLMAQSAPGAALVSADVRRTIRGPLAERLVSRGQLKLDKMAETIEAFALAAVASVIAASQSPPTEPVLAVLPFDNQSTDPEMQFFSDGVSEEVLQIVARAQGIRVIGKGSSFQFRGGDKSVRKVAAELQASHVLDGSVRRSGSQIRVTAHLVEAASQMTLWTERFDRQLSDVFALQDEIAGAIAGSLKTQLSVRSRKPVDPAAYDIYLRARKEITKEWASAQINQTVSLLEQAVAMAPDFAAAWGFLAFLRTLQIVPFHDPDGRPEHTAAVAAARRALSLDPDCADAVLASNAVLPAFSNYEEKLKNSARAALLAPSDASTLSTRAFALTSVGHVRDALAIYRRAVEVEPNVPWLHAQYALAMTAAGQVDEGMALINDIHRQGHPNQWIPLSRAFSLTYLAAKDERLTDEALASLEEAPSESQVPDMMTVAIARIKAVLRGMLQAKPLEHDAREQTLEAILSSGPELAVNISFCQIAAAMGHAHLGLRLLHAALDNGRSIFGVGGGRHNAAMHLFYLHASPLRNDPEFARLCARLGLAQFWQTSGKWPDCADEVPYDFKAECERAANALR